MPARDQIFFKQYVVLAGANVVVQGFTPAVDDRRYLLIQNTGINPGFVRINLQVQLDGGDLNLAANQIERWDINCPNEAISFLSPLGTTFAVIEGVATSYRNY